MADERRLSCRRAPQRARSRHCQSTFAGACAASTTKAVRLERKPPLAPQPRARRALSSAAGPLAMHPAQERRERRGPAEYLRPGSGQAMPVDALVADGAAVTVDAVANHASITAVTVDICEDIGEKTPSEVGTIAKLISLCTNLTFLHLSLRPEMALCRYVCTGVLRGLTRLRQLELRGFLLDDHSVASTVALLQSTNNLEALSLFPVPPDPPNKMAYYFSDSDSDRYLPKDDKDSGDGGNIFVPKSLWRTNVRCLKYKVKKIRFVGYRGHRFERILAKFLLSKAQVLDEISVSMATGRKDEVEKELTSWRCNSRARITCA